jgi:hypothetical protein
VPVKAVRVAATAATTDMVHVHETFLPANRKTLQRFLVFTALSTRCRRVSFSASSARAENHDICLCKWRQIRHPVREFGASLFHARIADEDKSSDDLAIYHSQNKQREDDISYQLIDDAILAIHGSYPPKDMLLVCKKVYVEAREQFLSVTTFEIHPLTPSDGSWIFEYYATVLRHPAYEYLVKSLFVPIMRKARLRVDMARFACYRLRQPRGRHARMITAAMYDEIDLETCTKMLAKSSKRLCEILKTCALNLRVVEIHWVDDFPHVVSGPDLEMRAHVLRPLSELDGVTVRVKELVMAGKGREDMFRMFECTLV